MEKEMRQQEAIRITKWVAEYPEIANQIVNVEQCITPEECIETIDLLAEHGFEYLVPILLHTANYNDVTDKAISRLYAEGIATVWEQKGTAYILDDLKHKIRQEIARKDLRKNEDAENESFEVQHEGFLF